MAPLTAEVLSLRDAKLRKLEREARRIMRKTLDYREVARLGGPGGVDDLIIAGVEPDKAS